MTQDVSNLSGVAVLGPRTDMTTVANLSAVAVLGPPAAPGETFATLSNLSAVVVLGPPEPVAPADPSRFGTWSLAQLRQKLARPSPLSRGFIRR